MIIKILWWSLCVTWVSGLLSLGQTWAVAPPQSPARSLAPSAPASSPEKPVPKTEVIEVTERQDCPSERSLDIQQPSQHRLYLDLEAMCRRANQRPVAVILGIQHNGVSRACTDLGLRERRSSQNLRWWQEPVGKGMALCSGDVLVTWRGVEVRYVSFKDEKGANGKATGRKVFAEPGRLSGMGRLSFGDEENRLLSGRLYYFFDPDYQERRIALGVGGKKLGGAGTFVSVEVTDACQGEGMVGVPNQAPGAKGEVHGVKLCEKVGGAEERCGAVLQEGQFKSLTSGGEASLEQMAAGSQLLWAAAATYGGEKELLEAAKIKVPTKDNDYVPPPPRGELKVRVIPEDSLVWLDGERLTLKQGAASVQLVPGEHLLLAENMRGEQQTKAFGVVSGQPTTVQLSLPPLLSSQAGGLEWISLPGTGPDGFMMGSKNGVGEDDERPRHKVVVQPFKLSKTEVTVAQYQACVDAGKCTEPATHTFCNWKVKGREQHPINCLDWHQAKAYAAWLSIVVGGTVRLPTEAEWEYAARGKEEREYPWGDSPEPSCDVAVLDPPGAVGDGCGQGSTWPVCSKEKGNTPSGLCDMGGNVWEWVEDCYEGNYKDAPVDGSARTVCSSYNRVLRGGSWSCDATILRGADRALGLALAPDLYVGFRVVWPVSPGAASGL